MTREFLPGGNSFTKPYVEPANWNKPGASISKQWRIRYRYYDPVAAPTGRYFSIRDMNQYKTLPERREATKELLRLLRERITRDKWNPVTGTYPATEAGEINPTTDFNQAIDFARDRMVCGEKTKIQIRQAAAQIKKAARELHFDHLAICEIRQRHVKFILDKIGKNKGGWSSPTNFNNFRSSFKMLFNVLQEVEATEFDPVTKIRKMQIVHKIRETLTLDERKSVNTHLRNHYPDFFRFLNIFFHSGARVSELLRLKGSDVDLSKQRFKVTVIKGRKKMETYKTIKDIAVPYWKQLKPKADQYVFSRDLVPGYEAINPIQISRRWRNHVKDKKTGLGITADLYSLKHSHTSEMVDLLSTEAAAEHNSHADTSMVAKVYDIRRADRNHERVKKLNNPL